MNTLTFLLSTAMTISGSPVTEPESGPISGIQREDSVRSSIEKSRQNTMDWLRSSPTSYLAAVARVDFGEKRTLTIGSAASNDVVVSDPDFKQRHLSVTVVGDSFHVRPIDPSAVFLYKDVTYSSGTTLPAAYLSVGRFSVRLSHQRFPAIIIFDPNSPRFDEYKGLKYYPVDLRYRYTLDLIRDPDADTVVIQSTRGNRRNAVREGWFAFMVESVPCTLEVSRLLEPGIGEDMYSIFFQDKTTGSETYAVGRYLDPEPLGDGTFILDFNKAYNPACAISPFYNCPLPPEENELPVRIPAGEKDAHYGEH